ncbi:RNA polymerase sigma factor [Parvicella tangerina]|uniref:RNA polymerase sigma factor YlaC n=1 Tax=Parvicella tangerina TaxID=2829795 RepID=A0A916JLW5_9FLAO|nr:RNA polymerase sigma factor [Parvicella tangerina]CAG5080504.1 RNA polymerase sigma factor YlaC [Parvicella tangerina]
MNRREYNKVVVTYSENVFRYAFKWTRNEQDSKDLVQDVFGKLWEFRKKVEFKSAKPWLFTCMHNALVNFSKKKSVVEHILDVNAKMPIMYQPNYALKDLLQKSLAQLSDVQRSIVILRDSEGYSYEEIGDILELSESQVKVYLFRARKKVKEQLKDLSELVA